jgi:5-dehydro-2-deoxygluconokinase
VSRWSEEGGHELILELLVAATDDDLARVGGDTDRYDAEIRPGQTVEAMQFLQDRGVEPAIWKIEGLATREAAERIAAAARRDGRTAQCIVLGRHAPTDRLNEWLRIAAPVEGFLGFAIGRSIWWDVLEARLAGEIDEADARRRVAENYAGFVRVYLEALGG